jgi:hypothetical protein
MNLMISETFLQHAAAAVGATHVDVAVDILSYAIGECALGRVLLARSANGVCAILIGADHDALEADLVARFPHATLVANEAVVRTDGDLAGYPWGIERKRELIRKEMALSPVHPPPSAADADATRSSGA